ncbi:hypothetical protein AYI70_g4501 [Smittium culicis]|uniref:Oxidoreductase-like domain-containing protein n=1 Tax=Smittium culicis TaxID=133412 RepID=A0A1R1XZ63_9FUNG|nr:hypothetical protein AYI70_g4501 [Smittium culicis]
MSPFNPTRLLLQAKNSKLNPKLAKLQKLMPIAPPPPDPDTCCGTDCEVCVYDTYQLKVSEFSTYANKLRTLLELNHSAVPKNIQKSQINQLKLDSYAIVSISEFKKLEKALS